jgi:hypothetical protein
MRKSIKDLKTVKKSNILLAVVLYNLCDKLFRSSKITLFNTNKTLTSLPDVLKDHRRFLSSLTSVLK